VLFLADAEPGEVENLGRLIYRMSKGELRKGRLPAGEIVSNARSMWSGLPRLAGGSVPPGGAAEAKAMKNKGLVNSSGLSPFFAMNEKIGEWEARLRRKSGPAKQKRGAKGHAPSPRFAKIASNLAPAKTFAGFAGWEDLTGRERLRLTKETGIVPGWGPPGWMQLALDLSTGKRNLLEIHQAVVKHVPDTGLGRLVRTFRFLARHGRIRFRAVLTRRDFQRAFHKLGIRKGDLVMAHTSLSGFGYVRGGADAVIDALSEAVGVKGTLAMPAHTRSWLGNPAFNPADPRTQVGLISQTFLSRPGVLRSNHPTHSIAAQGPLAAELTKDHDCRMPAMAREGAYGKFVEMDGKVVLLARLGSNTILHAGEFWAGAPFPDMAVHFYLNGRRREAVVPSAPMHTTAFGSAYAVMRRRGTLRKTCLGEGMVYAMKARDAVDAAMNVVRRNPLAVTEKGCSCRFCIYVRSKVAEQRNKR
jgi:aminoglycoside 3-N-acetyltransferase